MDTEALTMPGAAADRELDSDPRDEKIRLLNEALEIALDEFELDLAA